LGAETCDESLENLAKRALDEFGTLHAYQFTQAFCVARQTMNGIEEAMAAISNVTVIGFREETDSLGEVNVPSDKL